MGKIWGIMGSGLVLGGHAADAALPQPDPPPRRLPQDPTTEGRGGGRRECRPASEVGGVASQPL